jgi:hypothetical protein
MIQHVKKCPNLSFNILEFPKKNSYQFTQYEQLLQYPFVLYYDWECFIQPIKVTQEETKLSFTRKTALLDPSGYSIALVGPDNFLYANVYDKPNAIEHFIDHALHIANQVVL